jgi:hypothetical protein
VPTPIRRFLGFIKDGDLYLEREWQYQKLLTRLDGAEIELTIQKRRKPKSSQQNRYLHGVVIPIFADHLGYDNLEMREALKWRFLQVETGKLPTVRSIADLSSTEMTEFIDNIRRVAAEYGCDIPAPGEAEPLDEEEV